MTGFAVNDHFKAIVGRHGLACKPIVPTSIRGEHAMPAQHGPIQFAGLLLFFGHRLVFRTLLVPSEVENEFYSSGEILCTGWPPQEHGGMNIVPARMHDVIELDENGRLSRLHRQCVHIGLQTTQGPFPLVQQSGFAILVLQDLS